MKRWLLDTGPLVAYVDEADPKHESVWRALDGFKGRLYTTSSVITEAMHLVGDAPDGPAVLVEFIQACGLEIADITGRGVLASAAQLMKRYADTPMDFADATLVLLSERLKVLDIVTLDRRGFSAYRSGGRPFRLVL